MELEKYYGETWLEKEQCVQVNLQFEVELCSLLCSLEKIQIFRAGGR